MVPINELVGWSVVDETFGRRKSFKTLKKEGLENLYNWKRYGFDDINKLNEKRLADEYELISKNDKFADCIINQKV